MVSDNAHTFPCIQCGSQLDYLPGTLQMQCTHCGNQHNIQESHEPIHEYDYHATLKNLPLASPKAVHMTRECEACGAQTKVDTNIHADDCPFCGTTFVLDSAEHRVIEPKSLLPFAINAKEAQEAYKSWIKRLWFAPNKIKKYAKQDQGINGVYVPYWTYDCNTDTEYSGERGDVHHVRRRVRVQINGRWTTQVQMVPEVRWRPIRGRVSNRFDDTLIYASNTLPRELSRELAPWDLNNLRPFQEEFLSGFRSEVYQTDLDDGFAIAQRRLSPYIAQSIRRDIGGDQQRIHQTRTQYNNVSFKHCLLPFWIAGFRFRRKTYQFVVNGRTGEVQGDRPWSWMKIAFTVALILGLLITVITLGSQDNGYSNFGLSDGLFHRVARFNHS